MRPFLLALAVLAGCSTHAKIEIGRGGETPEAFVSSVAAVTSALKREDDRIVIVSKRPLEEAVVLEGYFTTGMPVHLFGDKPPSFSLSLSRRPPGLVVSAKVDGVDDRREAEERSLVEIARDALAR